MSLLVVIPARMASSRFPGKMLAPLSGRPMILHVCERASRIPDVDRLLVATDHKEILRVVEDAGFAAVMTSSEHRSGSDRVAEASRGWTGWILNLQGDEPLFDPRSLTPLLRAMEESPEAEIGTLACPLGEGESNNPDRVKVCFDEKGLALDFSRQFENRRGETLRHIGVYLYRPGALEKFISLPPTKRESSENLEQLRALESGMRILVATVENWSPGVDRPEDLKVIEKDLEAL
ncbi:MAG: 3-deoxy-manno-octulosonate cytidylyltransferase [Candidatus Krumholzibacteria bacterium]|jgi:3-deoxy-manno-octulosonate cytidylyltransferase (CMP-KDO synthetase)|nr:3-deoxy-manno-octulosonate cytidylyltransferase [Candidatus Krumholzibacteria bacterium]MDP6669453.1 3-deoxy-manno-octulosonate cytidylyltransferase [Candidatus Krumholzibacteria bacterium]MDP6797289.1 3-deoxy-manno-octulosonate cytidylyltransferase [Candidatus Krumholzibacteria bacterium]MDP7021224.1 3-deoxy-manno-octulosonate cytidylyltransferase [Candidatus Krumholzibacteria bacterium]